MWRLYNNNKCATQYSNVHHKSQRDICLKLNSFVKLRFDRTLRFGVVVAEALKCEFTILTYFCVVIFIDIYY